MILDKVRATVRAYGLLKKGAKVVAGVSGGPDSLALLYLLNSLKREYALSLHVAHLDHGLRKGSAKDLEFVARQAGLLKLPFTGERAVLPGTGEEAARKARQEFLFRTAKRLGAGTVALGHSLDDQAETLLMRLIRGTGLLGLAGIAPKREFAGLTVIRPLIEVSRREIEGYLRKRRLRPRIDETNLRDVFFRNRIRGELLPLLEKKYNRNIKQILGNTAQNAGYDYDYLARAAQKASGAGRSISLDRLSGMHPALKRLALRLMVERVQGDTRRLTFRHILEIEDLARYRTAGSVVDLPKNVSVKKTAKNLVFYRVQAK